MALNLWGRDPGGKLRAYALGISRDILAEYIDTAKGLGWTELMTSPYERTETTLSESSVEPTSTETPAKRSRKSAKSSPASTAS